MKTIMPINLLAGFSSYMRKRQISLENYGSHIQWESKSGTATLTIRSGNQLTGNEHAAEDILKFYSQRNKAA